MRTRKMNKPIILTGDRTTGPLHIGHYAGSLANRLRYQDSHDQFLLLADTQALTDNAQDPAKVRRSVIEILLAKQTIYATAPIRQSNRSKSKSPLSFKVFQGCLIFWHLV